MKNWSNIIFDKLLNIQEFFDEDGYLDNKVKRIAADINQEPDQGKKFLLNQERQKYILKKLKKKIDSGEKIRVCFFVVFDFAWAYKPIYEAMLKDKTFDPFIVVIPDISRGKENLNFYFSQAYTSLSKKYQKVFKGYSVETEEFFDFSQKVDLICFPNTYENMTNYRFEIDYFLDKSVLPFYVNYSFSVTTWFRKTLQDPAYSYFWKVFIPTASHLEEFQKHQPIKGKNAVVAGYCKMDRLAEQKIREREGKRIIIAPHHTITDWKFLQISNFLKYSAFFLRLPELYPEIDFVFRPHPLLVVQLKKPEIWGEAKTKDYLAKLTAFKNVTYSEGGDYLNLFSNSDGIIHDCGSFLAEYLFTEKPACYLLKDEQSKNWFIEIGKKCLDHCYQAYSEKEIINFIEKVIIKAEDPLKKKRVDFVNSDLKINYPFVTQQILAFLKKGLRDGV